jgi:hypothetical protein
MAVFWNCSHGMVAKMDLITHYIESLNPEVFFICEAEIKNDKDYACLNIENYQLEFSKTLKLGMARLAAYVKVNSGFKRKLELEDDESEVMVYSNGKKRICGLYRPFKPPPGRTNSEAFNILLKNLYKITECDMDIVVGGDFNVNWDIDSSKKRQLEVWAETSGLIQSVNVMTRHQEITSRKADPSSIVGTEIKESRIDLLFQLKPRKIEVIPSLGSDHHLLVLPLEEATVIKKAVTKKIVSIDWRNYSKIEVKKEASLMLFGGPDVRCQLDAINHNLTTILNKWAPKRVVRLRTNHQQFENCRIEALKKKRDRAWKKYKKTGSNAQYVKSKSLSKTLLKVIKKEKKRVFRAKMESHGSKGFWRTVGSLFKGTETRDRMTLEIDGQLTDDPVEIAGEFSRFFKDKITSLANKAGHIEPLNESQVMKDENWTPFSVAEIKEAVNLSKNKRSAGPDELPMCLIKDCGEALLEPLTELFNSIVSSGEFPEEWKIAKVVPIHKKGKRTMVENFRPVSNLSSVSKIFERCLLKRINAWYKDDECQHGFRSGHSTTSAALSIQHFVATGLDSNRKMAIYSLDMSAAFDLLRPTILDSMLHSMPACLRKMIASFLNKRKSYVEIDGQSSFLTESNIGVPQGSVLGPKLFTIYTGGMSSEVFKDENTRIVIYADDAYVVCSADSMSNLAELVENTMKVHVQWLRRRGMIVNADKTELMVFQSAEELVVNVDDVVIKSKPTMKVLGLEFDSFLTWAPQLNKAMMSCQRMKPALRCLRSKLSRKELLQVITSHYYSRLYYSSEVWYHSLNAKLKEKLIPMHYYPLRLALGDLQRQNSNHKISILSKRAPPFQFNNYKVAKMVIKITNSTEPFILFHELLSRAVIERRSPQKPWFLDMSRKRIGRQSLPNRVSTISKQMNFPWLDVEFSKDRLRRLLKQAFFHRSLLA